MSEETRGLSRVTELENILGELLDEWEVGNITPLEGMDEEGVEELNGIYDRARVILAREEEDLDPEEF